LDSFPQRTFLERLGAWAFSQRSWTPVPLALILILVRWNWMREPWILGLGLGVVTAGLAIRYWAVSYIGTISRTRAARFGPLMSAGPFALVRNPLYVGNFLIWIGFAIASGLLWMVPVAWTLFALQYSAIVRFEEAAAMKRTSARSRGGRSTSAAWASRSARAGRMDGARSVSASGAR
jgi:protein-S-isoprenylcysteine O-methyltransferase Ste14